MIGRFPLRSFAPALAPAAPRRVRPRLMTREAYEAATKTTDVLRAEYERVMRLFSPSWPEPGALNLENPAADPDRLEAFSHELARAGLAEAGYHLQSLAAQVRAYRAKRQAPGGAPLQPSTGTIFGKHSLGETRDLLARTAYRFGQAEKALNALTQQAIELRSQGRPINEAALGAIANDWGTLISKWRVDAKRFADDLASLERWYPLNAPHTIAAEDVWEPLVLYLRPEPDDFVKGALPDVLRRIEAMSGHPIDLASEPKMTARDFDFEVFSNLSAATRQLEEAAKSTRQASKSAFEVALPWIAGAGLLGLITLGLVYAPEIKTALKAGRRKK